MSRAESMRAFGTASRLSLLWAMLERERSVGQLVEATGIAPSAASHQLRLLRQERFVSVRLARWHAFYRLRDHLVADMLATIRFHHEHIHRETALPHEPVASGGWAAMHIVTPAREANDDAVGEPRRRCIRLPTTHPHEIVSNRAPHHRRGKPGVSPRQRNLDFANLRDDA